MSSILRCSIESRPKASVTQQLRSNPGYNKHTEQVLAMPALDPDCVKTCADQKPLESYSNTPPNHPRLEHSSTKAKRESRAPEEYDIARLGRIAMQQLL